MTTPTHPIAMPPIPRSVRPLPGSLGRRVGCLYLLCAIGRGRNRLAELQALWRDNVVEAAGTGLESLVLGQAVDGARADEGVTSGSSRNHAGRVRPFLLVAVSNSSCFGWPPPNATASVRIFSTLLRVTRRRLVRSGLRAAWYRANHRTPADPSRYQPDLMLRHHS
jgi:hypothetical protein